MKQKKLQRKSQEDSSGSAGLRTAHGSQAQDTDSEDDMDDGGRRVLPNRTSPDLRQESEPDPDDLVGSDGEEINVVDPDSDQVSKGSWT